MTKNWVPGPVLMKEMDGVLTAKSSNPLMPRSCMSFLVKTSMLTGTSCRFSLRLRAVTTISLSWPLSGESAAIARGGATARRAKAPPSRLAAKEAKAAVDKKAPRKMAAAPKPKARPKPKKKTS